MNEFVKITMQNSKNGVDSYMVSVWTRDETVLDDFDIAFEVTVEEVDARGGFSAKRY